VELCVVVVVVVVVVVGGGGGTLKMEGLMRSSEMLVPSAQLHSVITKKATQQEIELLEGMCGLLAALSKVTYLSLSIISWFLVNMMNILAPK
jgi:hypothetical protein